MKKWSMTYLDWEGPKRGFSGRGWNENLPRVPRTQSPWELVQQSLTSIVAMKTPIWIITNTDTTHVSLRRRRLDFINGIFWSWGQSGASFDGGRLMSMNSELSAIAKVQDSDTEKEDTRLVCGVWREMKVSFFCLCACVGGQVKRYIYL